MLRPQQQYPILGKACPAPGQKWLGAWGSLGAVHNGCQGTRISPKPCWVSLGVPQAVMLLLGAVTGGIREVKISNCQSCRNVCTNVCSGACLQL